MVDLRTLEALLRFNPLPEPPIQHLEPLGDAGDPAWGEVYLKLVGGGR